MKHQRLLAEIVSFLVSPQDLTRLKVLKVIPSRQLIEIFSMLEEKKKKKR
jgi:hypothetical protein